MAAERKGVNVGWAIIGVSANPWVCISSPDLISVVLVGMGHRWPGAADLWLGPTGLNTSRTGGSVKLFSYVFLTQMTRAVPPASCLIRVEHFVENATPAGIPMGNYNASFDPRALADPSLPL